MVKNKRGWIRIVEAFVSILLITGVLLIILDKNYIEKKDVSEKIYETELSMLREVQSDDNLRAEIVNLDGLPVKWDDENFPIDVKNKLISRTPNYLHCEANICELNDDCVLDKEISKDVYAKSVIITATLEKYSPRQLKLFCWLGEPTEQVPEKPKAIVSLVFSDTVYSLVNGVNYTYTHTRTFTESNGVGVNLTEGQICYIAGIPHCDPKGNVNYKIEENSQLVHEGKKFWTNYSQDTFTLKYWGVDDNGYDVYVEQHMCVKKKDFTENCEVE